VSATFYEVGALQHGDMRKKMQDINFPNRAQLKDHTCLSSILSANLLFLQIIKSKIAALQLVTDRIFVFVYLCICSSVFLYLCIIASRSWLATCCPGRILSPSFPHHLVLSGACAIMSFFLDVYLMMYNSTKDLLKGLIAGILFGGDFGRPESRQAQEKAPP